MSGSPLRPRSALRGYQLHFGPNMTPMVDVVMVILVFFMVSAAFVGPEWFLKSMVPRPVAAPNSGAPRPPSPRPGTQPDDSEMKLTKNQMYLRLVPGESEGAPPSVVWLAKRFATIQDFGGAMARFTEGDIPKGEIEVFIEPSSRVPYHEVIRLHELCEGFGVKKIGVIVR